MSIVGKVDKGPHADWFILEDGRWVTVHVAYLDAHPAHDQKSRIRTFFSDADNYASVTALKLGFDAKFIRSATLDEAEVFWASRPEIVKEVISV